MAKTIMVLVRDVRARAPERKVPLLRSVGQIILIAILHFAVKMTAPKMKLTNHRNCSGPTFFALDFVRRFCLRNVFRLVSLPREALTRKIHRP